MASGEFELIQKYFSFPASRADVSLGTGDDCAVVSVPQGRQLAVTTDTLVAGVHFPAGASPDNIAYKAVAVNLSDLAAMGAEPAWLTLALTLPEVNDDWLRVFSDEFNKTAAGFSVELIGGDVTRGPLSITVQAMGTIAADRIMRRDRAREGDGIYVSGTLGDAAAGLKILQQAKQADENEAWLVNRLNRPSPRVDLGMALAQFCQCAIDISDGLAADLGHILEASQQGATVYKDRIPLSQQLVACSNGREGIDWELVLAGGDDYELCLVVQPGNEQQLVRVCSDLSLPLTRIGVIENHGEMIIVDETGTRQLLDYRGYEHF